GRIVRWTETFTPLPVETSEPTEKPLLKPGQTAGSYSVNPAEFLRGFHEPMLPVKPPLEESDGLIEVGYDDSDDDSNNSYETTYESAPNEVNRPGTKVWMDSPSSFSPLGLNQISRDQSKDIETEM
ncbi:MAG: hypothetical protein ACKO0V_02265, partial [bacterium]